MPRMIDTEVEVMLEVEDAELARHADHGRYVVERCREAADKLCAESGARLRTDRAPSFWIERATHKLLGLDVVLVRSRWAVVAPEAALAGGN